MYAGDLCLLDAFGREDTGVDEDADEDEEDDAVAVPDEVADADADSGATSEGPAARSSRRSSGSSAAAAATLPVLGNELEGVVFDSKFEEAELNGREQMGLAVDTH